MKVKMYRTKKTRISPPVLWMEVRKKNNDHITVYHTSGLSTTYGYWSLLPSLKLTPAKNMIPGSGPCFSLQLSFLKWSMTILSREAWYYTMEDTAEDE